MKKYIKVIIYLVSFGIIIVLGMVGYNFLSNNYQPQERKAEAKESNLKKASDFEVFNRQGEKVKLSDFLGKPIIVNFWATWCEPCKIELPEFDEAYKKNKDEIEFLMVNLTDGYQETEESVTEFVKQNNYEFPLYFDTEYSATNTYRIYSIPQTLFINKEGNMVKSHIGMIDKESLEKYIEKLKQ